MMADKDTTTRTKATTAAKRVATADKLKAAAMTSDAPLDDFATASKTDAAAGDELKLRNLVDMAVARSGVKKKDAKPAIQAALAIIGETLADERELNLPPMGKLKVNRTKETGKARIIICKLRQKMPAQTSAAPLANPED